MRISMQTDDSFEDLHERFERLVSKRTDSLLSEARRRRIADKYAKKPLQELNEIARQLEANQQQ